MGEFKGTPGRWIKRGDGIIAPGGIEVAVVVNFQGDDMMNADANLIAAAPELLELVIHVRNCVENDGNYQPANLDYFNTIINKALGKTK